MAGGKLSPRQKMINMMYLVLTALLALNVTKEVINAFVTINESVELSKDNIDKKNQTTYEYFKKQMELDAAKYTAVNNQAQNIRKGATDLNKFIDDLKVKLIRTAEKLDEGVPTPKLPDMENKEDYDSPTHIMIGDDDAQGKKGEAVVLRNKLEAYKKLIIANAPKGSEADYQKRMDNLLSTKDPVKKEDGKGTWELVSFYHNPVVATVALLTKFQSDVRNAESQVIDDLLGSVDRNIVKLDKLAAKVIANSTVVTIGSDYQADVFLSATSSTMVPEVFIGATWDSVKHDKIGGSPTALPVEGGYAKFSERPSSEGEKKWNGVIRVQKPDGSYEGYNFSASYVAQKPSSVVAAEKMNVLYIGVDNPMAISVPGVSNNQVFPSIAGAGGSLKPNSAAGGGHFIATVTTVGEAKINVTAEIGGKKMPMGEFKYRVKRVPDPVATISNSKGGPINKSMLAAGTLIPQLENFDFELFFKITGFKMSIFAKGKDLIEYESTGNQLTPQMRDAIAKLRAGDKVFIEYIKAKMATGADQSTRSLSPMAFTIQ
ncbi:MAG: gliding motility protein GldM [Bacteroidetes bacterium]|nr:gliding motility protein GldM [Bacteroidota bacterium]MBP6426424.1 gliding motility protein GldM [Bacteroidia bacterium]MBP6656708.1 gliding motility protein GldM [Bacteroidia bacterium]